MAVAIVAHRQTPTNVSLARARQDVEILAPAGAVRRLREGDVAIARLDICEALDGIEIGLWELARLEGAGVRVLNRPRALVGAHDKLVTARVLADAGVSHPRTALVASPTDQLPFEPPVVVKPRFGSWGRDIALLRDRAEFRAHLAAIAGRRWFEAHGAIVQELVPPQGYDVRVVVAAGTVVGAARRVAQPGEWRTNVSLGARREPVQPTPEACELAIRTAAAIEGDLVGVDLLPRPDGSFTVIEVNAAVDFTQHYALDAGSVYERAMNALLPDPVAAAA